MSIFTTSSGVVVHEPGDPRSLALLFVQIVGIIVAASSVIASKFKPFCNISDQLTNYMMVALIVLLFLTLAVAFCNRDIGPTLYRGAGGTGIPPKFFRLVNLSQQVLIYTVCDLLVLSLLIYASGGSRQSLYSAFLFVIVPVTIVLRESPVRVGLYAFLTVFIFYGTLKYYNEAFEVLVSGTYNGWFAGITTLCVFFPTLLFFVVGTPVRATAALNEQTTTLGDV